MTSDKHPRMWQEIVLFMAFGLYLIIFLVLLFFKASASQSINLIPFHTISDYLSHGRPLGFSNIIGNIILLIPMGVYIALFSRPHTFWRTVLSVALISLSAEVLQYSM
ncbi:MAG: VanZ family protein, partial [Candidatus Limiplasma sp.]|nr:VanZ family protein [Candidatus Limiplasma sp.]